MNNQYFWRFYLVSLALAIGVSFYPIYMGVQVVRELLRNGAIPMVLFRIPPIAIAVILGVLLIPVFQKLSKRLDFLIKLRQI